MNGIYSKSETMTWSFAEGSLENLGQQVDECIRSIGDDWVFDNVSLDSTVTKYGPLGTAFGFTATVWAKKADSDG